jgi:bud site selection protein 31
MPRIKTSRTKPPPEGFEDIQYVIIVFNSLVQLTARRDILEDYDKKMRDAENESHEGKRKVESVW